MQPVCPSHHQATLTSLFSCYLKTCSRENIVVKPCSRCCSLLLSLPNNFFHFFMQNVPLPIMLIAQAGTKAQSKKNLERNDLFTRMKRLKNDIQLTFPARPLAAGRLFPGRHEPLVRTGGQAIPVFGYLVLCAFGTLCLSRHETTVTSLERIADSDTEKV